MPCMSPFVEKFQGFLYVVLSLNLVGIISCISDQVLKSERGN